MPGGVRRWAIQSQGNEPARLPIERGGDDHQKEEWDSAIQQEDRREKIERHIEVRIEAQVTVVDRVGERGRKHHDAHQRLAPLELHASVVGIRQQEDQGILN